MRNCTQRCGDARDAHSAAENASDLLAAVNNVDFRWQYTTSDAYKVLPGLKLKYELHDNFTEVTESDENDFENIFIKPI